MCARGWQARKHSSSRLGTRRAHARDFHGVVGPTVREWGSRATHHTPASLAIGMPRPLCPRRTTSVRRGPVRTAARASTPRTPATIGRKWPHTLINCTLPSAGRAPGTNSWPRNPSPSHSHSLPATRGGEVSGTWTFPAATATRGRSLSAAGAGQTMLICKYEEDSRFEVLLKTRAQQRCAPETQAHTHSTHFIEHVLQVAQVASIAPLLLGVRRTPLIGVRRQHNKRHAVAVSAPAPGLLRRADWPRGLPRSIIHAATGLVP